jgi:hypothetical protein
LAFVTGVLTRFENTGQEILRRKLNREKKKKKKSSNQEQL